MRRDELEHEDESTNPSKESLADQALEAIVRSQQLRARSRILRRGRESGEDHPEKKNNSELL